MKIWIGQTPPKLTHEHAVTIGNFDGVHSGHLHILQRLKQQAKERHLNSMAIIFEPQPTEFFKQNINLKNNINNNPDSQPYRITPLRDKLRLLAQTQCLDAVWVQRFNPQFANLSAEDFIQNILLNQLNTKYLLIGDDFRFGKNRVGDFDLLSQHTDFITEKTPSILVAGVRASSTAVREALKNGRLDIAKNILGHDYSLSGRVKHGAKLGRTLGCPTANIHLPTFKTYRYALQGVFVVEVLGRFGRKRGVASFGVNPTVSNNLIPKLEVHLFDFHESINGNLYGERLEIIFLHKLRDEIKFTHLDDLKKQIWQDMDSARNWHSN